MGGDVELGLDPQTSKRESFVWSVDWTRGCRVVGWWWFESRQTNFDDDFRRRWCSAFVRSGMGRWIGLLESKSNQGDNVSRVRHADVGRRELAVLVGVGDGRREAAQLCRYV